MITQSPTRIRTLKSTGASGVVPPVRKPVAPRMRPSDTTCIASVACKWIKGVWTGKEPLVSLGPMVLRTPSTGANIMRVPLLDDLPAPVTFVIDCAVIVAFVCSIGYVLTAAIGEFCP